MLFNVTFFFLIFCLNYILFIKKSDSKIQNIYLKLFIDSINYSKLLDFPLQVSGKRFSGIMVKMKNRIL